MPGMSFAPFILLTAITSTPSGGSDLGKDGGLSKAEIAGAVKAHLMSVKACYERALAKNATLKGTVVLAWNVEPNGHVSAARVASSTMNSSEVENCIVDEVARWTFPTSSGKTHVNVFPFVFDDEPPRKPPADAGVPSLSNMVLQRTIILPRFARSAARR
ncbi:MAG: Glycine-rich cell wall structural protein 1 precursor [Myxococcales bacterium]|nr:Glycine-rich cell wall structural protein 1 precursor [Myxococcales bacterium]